MKSTCCNAQAIQLKDEIICYKCGKACNAEIMSGNDLSRMLSVKYPRLGPEIWMACCDKYGSGGTPEASEAYTKIVLKIKEVL